MSMFDPSEFTILVVEDHKFSRKALLNMLVQAGYENLLSAKHGQQAIEKLNNNDIHLVVTDINMPIVNGLELIKHIREGRTNAPCTTSIIAVTTLSDTETIASSMTLEVDAFLVKPITVKNAQEQIKNAVSEPNKLYQQHLYRQVSTEVHIPANKPKAPAGEPRIREVSSHVTQIEKLSQLQDGMTILDDIFVTTGGCLLKAGTKLNKKLLKRLNELSTVIEVHPFYARTDETQLAC